jgi:hypothetical protein
VERGLLLAANNGWRPRNARSLGNAGVEKRISESDFALRQDRRDNLGGCENEGLKAHHQDRITVSNAKAEVGNTFVIFPLFEHVPKQSVHYSKSVAGENRNLQ